MSIFKKAIEALTGKQKEKELQEQLKKKEEEFRQTCKQLEQLNEQLIETELDLNLAKIALEPLKNCKNKVIYNVNTQSVTVVDCGGNSYSGVTTSDVVEKLKTATTEEIITLLTPPKIEEKTEENNIEQEEKEIVSNFLDIFDGVEDFEVVGNSLFFKGIRSVEIPSLIVARFIEILENNKTSSFDDCADNASLLLDEEYQSLKAFTYWLLLNTIESARKDALDFIRKNQLPITSNGMLVTFRKVVSKGKTNKELVKFISESYFKVKKWKKSTSKFKVITVPNSNIFELKPFEFNVENTDYICLGDLNYLYNNLPKFEENIFTDSHTKSKIIKIGEVYKEDEEKIDLDNTKDCSSGLHSGSLSFGSFNSFGDTGVICLVNPMKIRSVPVSDCSKMRSSELFPVAIVDFDDYKEFVETQEIAELSEVYYNESIEFLQETLKNKQFGNLTCQEKLPEVSLKDVESISNMLKNRIVTI